MLRLPPFRLLQPGRIDEVVALLDEENCRVVAGGTDLWPNMKRGLQPASTVVSLGAVSELEGIENVGTEGDLRIGAMSRLDEVAENLEIRARFPAVAEAAGNISSLQLRNMGTIGGNLCLDTRCTYYNQSEGWRRSIDYCMKAEGHICWVAPSSPRCWAWSAGDLGPVLCALGARVTLVSVDGTRSVACADLFTDDGIEYLSKRRNELLTEVVLPGTSDVRHCHSAFAKLRRRSAIDFSALTVTAALWGEDKQRPTTASLMIGAVASAPVSVDLGQILADRKLDEQTITEISQAARKAARPMDNADFRAQWRGRMVEVYTRSTLRRAAGLMQE